MSQYSQRYWQYSLVITFSVTLLLLGCSASPITGDQVAIQAAEPEQEDFSNESALEEDGLSAADPFEGIYSSFTDEMARADGGLSADQGGSDAPPPLEFLSEIFGGSDALTSDIPTWLIGEQFMRLLEPIAFSIHNDGLYILDSGRQALFRYVFEENKIITVLDLSQYLRGNPAGLVFNDEGYYFISDPQRNRVLKFNSENILVAVYEDTANLASPGKLYFDNERGKLYISDGVYSRILVASKYGEFLYALGGRGTEPGQFVSITDFSYSKSEIYITDVIAKKPVQVLNNEGDFLRAYSSQSLSIPAAIAIDEQGYVYVADHQDDTIRVFVEGELRWKIGGSGTQPGHFRKVTQMMVSDGKLYVLDSLNRRIQVFKINS